MPAIETTIETIDVGEISFHLTIEFHPVTGESVHRIRITNTTTKKEMAYAVLKRSEEFQDIVRDYKQAVDTEQLSGE